MTLTFAGTLDRPAVLQAVDALVDLVAAPAVAAAWERESALPGMTVGGSPGTWSASRSARSSSSGSCRCRRWRRSSLTDYYARVDWLDTGRDDPENTSIRDDFNEMAGPGHADSVAVLEKARAELGPAIAAAAPTTYVPWQDCALRTDDFLVCRLLEIVVHADDLAVSVGHPHPRSPPRSSTRSSRCSPRCRCAGTGRTRWCGRWRARSAPPGRCRRSVSRASRRVARR